MMKCSSHKWNILPPHAMVKNQSSLQGLPTHEVQLGHLFQCCELLALLGEVSNHENGACQLLPAAAKRGDQRRCLLAW